MTNEYSGYTLTCTRFLFRYGCGIRSMAEEMIWTKVLKARNRIKFVAVHNVGIFTIQGVCSRAEN